MGNKYAFSLPIMASSKQLQTLEAFSYGFKVLKVQLDNANAHVAAQQAVNET